MKKVLAMALCVLMIAAMMTIGASAANSVEIAVGSATAKAGDEVQINVEMPKNEGIIAAALEVEYDRTALELVKSKDGGLISGPVFPKAENDPYILLWNSGDAEDSTATGTLATLTFKVKSTAAAGDYAIALSIMDDDENNCYDVNFDNVALTLTAGKITVEAGADNTPATDAPATDAPVSDDDAATDAPATDAPASDDDAATDAPATDAPTTEGTPSTGDAMFIYVALAIVAAAAVVAVSMKKKEN